MLLKAAEPGERYRVLERFYRLDARLIARFYAANSTLLDRMRSFEPGAVEPKWIDREET